MVAVRLPGTQINSCHNFALPHLAITEVKLRSCERVEDSPPSLRHTFRDPGSSILTFGTEPNRTPKNKQKKRLDVSGRFLKIQLMWSMIIFNDRVILSSDSLWFAQKSSTRTQHSRMMFHVLLRIRERQNWLEHQTKSRNLEPGTYKITSKTWMNVSSENAIKIWNPKTPQVEGWFKRCHGSCNQQFFEKSSAKMGIFPWWNLLSIKNGCLIGILMLTFYNPDILYIWVE